MNKGNKNAQKGAAAASAVVNMRVTPEKKKLYKSLAAKNNQPLSVWMQATLDAAVAKDI